MTSLSTEILFEKFQIIEVLKKDEHAAVFLANHIYLSKKIILKVLNTQKIHDPSLVERFKREAKILAKLDHPNIIKVLDFGMSKEFFYISFEYIEGESLRNALKTKALSYEQKEHLMIQLLQGLDYAHVNQIIHRDIKPENIFIDKNLNVKIGDFGLAISGEDNYVTNPYSIVGTPSYMSPEQVRGAKLTAQSDLFSMGVVLFELFTGENPFLKENVSLTLNEINSYNENALEEKLSDVPENIKNVLLGLLKKNINQRYSSAAEVLEELDIHTDQPNVIVASVNREEIKSRLAWILLAVIVIVIVAVIVIPKISEQKQNPVQLGTDQGTTQSNNNFTNKNNSTVPINNDQTKDQVDLNKLNKPLVDSQKQSENAKPTEENKNNSLGIGWLTIDCQPWAQVWINARDVGKTPFNGSFPLQPGEYSLKFVHQDFPIYSMTVVVKADQIVPINVNLETLTMGFINCFISPPVGDIFINERLKAQAPMRENDLIRVSPVEPVHLVIKNPNFKDIDTSFVIHARDTLRLKFRFIKK